MGDLVSSADRETALHVDPATGVAEVFATADHPTPHVYFLKPAGPPVHCKKGEPLTTSSITVYRLAPGGRFDLTAWRGDGGVAYELRAEGGVLRSSRESNY